MKQQKTTLVLLEMYTYNNLKVNMWCVWRKNLKIYRIDWIEVHCLY